MRGRLALRGALVAVAALAALAWQPAVGAASQEVIKGPGPLSAIYVDEGLACQVQASGDADTSFYGGTEPGGCGTFLALTEGSYVHDEEEGDHKLFGPRTTGPGSTPEAEFTPAVSGEPPSAQTLTGSGTEASPYVITTHVYVEEALPDPSFEPIAELTEKDSYVTGQDFYTTAITITNLGQARLEGTLYHAGDCYLADSDDGFGATNVPSAGSVACTVNADNSPPGRYMAFTPIATEGFPVSSEHFVEGLYSSVWADVEPEATEFPDTVEAATYVDNGMGLSWPIKLAGSDSPPSEHEATLKLTTTVLPSSPPSSSSSVGACDPSGVVVVSVSAVNGPKAVDYVLDGVSGSVPTNASGEASISLPPGQHTLEYWGEDETGAQESTHHVVNVTVASGGPSLSITSEQGRSQYEVGETGSVSIVASGPGLTSNPSAAHVPISTATPGSFSVSRSAADACGTTSASFAYTVIPRPVLGKTVNVDVVSGKVFVALPSTGSASSAAGPAGAGLFAGPLQAGFPGPAQGELAGPAQGELAEAAQGELAGAAQAGFAGSLRAGSEGRPGAAVEGLSKGLHFIPLVEARQIPVGSVLDTTAGVARVTTATATVGKLQAGEFDAGIFKLLQARKLKGLTEMDIMDVHSARQVCASVGKRAVAAKLSSKVLGRLNANAHGHFSTRGQYSAATVRGTIWSVANRCDGTFTYVKRGAVSVRDFVRRKTIALFTGQSYLARP